MTAAAPTLLRPPPIALRPSVTTPVRRRSGLRTVLAALLLVGLVVGAISQRALLAGVPGALGHARLGWVALAGLCAAVSVPALAMQQRQLMGVGGRRPPVGLLVSTTVTGNAISVSVPLVGSEMSVAYTYRRLARHGVDRAAVAWALIVSGLLSATAFAALVAVGALVSGNGSAAVAGLVTLVTVVLPGGALVLGLRSRVVRDRAVRIIGPVEQRVHRLTRGRSAAPGGHSVTELVAQIGHLHTRRSTLPVALGWSLLNWASDLACLGAALEAVGASVPWRGLILAWAAGAGVSSLGLTPGGLGVVEAALAFALVGAGLPYLAAVSGVLVYRVFSLWLAVLTGWLLLAGSTSLVGRLRPRAWRQPV